MPGLVINHVGKIGERHVDDVMTIYSSYFTFQAHGAIICCFQQCYEQWFVIEEVLTGLDTFKIQSFRALNPLWNSPNWKLISWQFLGAIKNISTSVIVYIIKRHQWNNSHLIEQASSNYKKRGIRVSVLLRSSTAKFCGATSVFCWATFK